MSRRAAALLAIPLALVACRSSREGTDRATGPAAIEVPAPDLKDMEPQVASLLRQAREEVVRNTESHEAWGDLGAVYDAHGLQEPAGTCYRRAQQLAPDDFRWAYLFAIVREIGGAETEEVVELFAEASRMRPDYAPIYVRLGDALSLRGEHEQATRHFRRAIELAPQIAIAHRGLGQVLLARDLPAEAVEPLNRAVALGPRDLSAYSSLAQALMRLGEQDRAREVIERSKGLQPINAFADPIYGSLVFMRSVSSSRAFSRAMAEIRDGAFDRAIVDLKLVLAARPEDASTHHWLGTAYRGQGQAASAIEHFTRAVELEPRFVKSRLQLAGLLAQRGGSDDLAAAAEHCRQSLRLDPDNAEAQSLLERLQGR